MYRYMDPRPTVNKSESESCLLIVPCSAAEPQKESLLEDCEDRAIFYEGIGTRANDVRKSPCSH